MTFVRCVLSVLCVALLATACGKSKQEAPAPTQSDAASAVEPPVDAAEVVVDAADVVDAAEAPTLDAAVAAAGEDLWQDPENDELVNPLEWNGVTLKLVVTERTDARIKGKLTATHDAMTMDVATWELDATVDHWVLVARKGDEAALRFGWAMDMKTTPAGPGAENFVELGFDKKKNTVSAKRKWSGTRLDKEPAWAKGYIKVI